MSHRLLLISHDVVGTRMAGPGIRAWELACALAEHIDVCLIAPRPIDLSPPDGLQLGSYTIGHAASLAPWLAAADRVVANGALVAAHPELAQIPVPLLLDLYDPFFFENLELFRTAPPQERTARASADLHVLQHQLSSGDSFICATERQRDFYLGGLMLLGRVTPDVVEADPQLRRLLDVVPFGLPPDPPVRTGPGLRDRVPNVGSTHPLILWSGGLWDWMDPVSLVQAMPAVLAQIPEARLVFLAGTHPGTVTTMGAATAARSAAAALGLLDHAVIFYEEWVPYAERVNVLLDADVLVSLHRHHLETQYAAVRSRVLDHFWVGRPSVLSDGDAAAALIREHQAGFVVPPGDVAALSATLIHALRDPHLRRIQGQRAQALAETLAWPHLIAPMMRFVTDPPIRLRERRMAALTPPAPVSSDTEASLIEQRQAALRLIEARWNDVHHVPAGASLFVRMRQRMYNLLARPLLPLLAAQIHANYAATELSDVRAQMTQRQIAALTEHVHQLAGQVHDRVQHQSRTSQ